MSAVAIYNEVIDTLGELGEDGLYLEATACSRLACAFGGAERYKDAEDRLRRAQSAANKLKLAAEIHGLVWIEAILAWKRGSLDEAKDLLNRAQLGLKKAGEVGNAALVGVDLARLHLDLRDPAEAQRAAAEAVPVLESLVLEREALASVGVLAKAASRNAVSAEVLASARRLLELKFGGPSLELLLDGGGPPETS